MAGASLGAGVHLLPVFLILEYNGYVVGSGEKVWVGEQQHAAGAGAVDNAAHSDPFGSAGCCGFGILAGAHSKEERSNH